MLQSAMIFLSFCFLVPAARAEPSAAYRVSDTYTIKTLRTLGHEEKGWKKTVVRHTHEACVAAIQKCSSHTGAACAHIGRAGIDKIMTRKKWTQYEVTCTVSPIEQTGDRLASMNQ